MKDFKKFLALYLGVLLILAPFVWAADTKITDLTAATVAAGANEIPINEAGADKKVTIDQIATYLIKRTAGTTTAAGAYETYLVLAANSGDITGTGLTTVLSITAAGVGRYSYHCQLVYQTTATGTGIDVAINHTGTTTQFLAIHRFSATGTTASTAAASMAAASATGNVYESQGTRTTNAIIGAGTVSVDAANSDMMSIIEGFFVVSVSGDFELKLAAESAALVTRAMQGTFCGLKKLS